MENSRVHVHSKLSVVSGKPTEPGKIHQLSVVDQAMGVHTIHIVFYYGSNPFLEGPLAAELDNIRVTLSRVLDQYPVVTGRLDRGPDVVWQVKCNDAGVRMLQASVSVTLDEWLRSADAAEERDLTLWEDMPDNPAYWSPFRIQINNFQGGGLAIGLSCSHMHADITSATLLIKSWTELHRGLPLTHPPIFHPPPTPTPPPHTPNIPSFSSTPKHAHNPSRRATFTMKFSGPTLEKRLSQLRPQCPDATPFDVLAALFWSRIARHQRPPLNDQERSLSICVDSRSQPNSLIFYGYFGNAMHFSTLTLNADELVNGGLGLVSGHVHRHVAGLKGDHVLLTTYGPRLTCINGEGMVDAGTGEGLMYGAVFDKVGKPVHVSYHVGNVEGEGLILVMPSPEGGLGRLVTVTLPEEQVANLRKDEAILDLEPTMVLSGDT